MFDQESLEATATTSGERRQNVGIPEGWQAAVGWRGRTRRTPNALCLKDTKQFLKAGR